MHGTLLKASATNCVGIAERSSGNDLPRSQTHYLNVVCGYALARTIEARNLLSTESCLFQIWEISFSRSNFKYNTRQRQQGDLEIEEERKDRLKKRSDKD